MSGQPAGGTGQAVPGALGAIELDERRTAVIAALEKTLRTAPQYSEVNRASQRRLNGEAGLGGRGGRVVEEMLGSSNPFFGAMGKDIRRAELRYVALPDGADMRKVKLAMSHFIGEGRVYTGASVTCSELTCKNVCDELMECAASASLTVPSILASLRHFIVEVRRGDDILQRFFQHSPGRRSTAGSSTSD